MYTAAEKSYEFVLLKLLLGASLFYIIKKFVDTVSKQFYGTFESWAYVLLWITCEKAKIKQRGRGEKAGSENPHSSPYLLHMVLLTGKSLCSRG